MLFVQVMCAEMRRWRSGDVRAAVKHSGRGRKFPSSVIAVLTPASVQDATLATGEARERR
jgi:hypothetical protein